MFTRDERRAFLFLMGIAAAGGVARLVWPGAAAPGAALVAPHLAGGDITAQAARAKRAEELARPLAPGEVVDLDRADAREIERLPRVGPALAQRIVTEREANGPFGSLEGLSRVPGIGAGTLALLRPWVRFSGVAALGPPAARPPTGGGGGQAGRPDASADACASLRRPLPLNSADAVELACLPGIGPALAARIIADRNARGPFAEVQALERVPGIGPVLLARLAGHVRAP
jgi:competence protein ComEA